MCGISLMQVWCNGVMYHCFTVRNANETNDNGGNQYFEVRTYIQSTLATTAVWFFTSGTSCGTKRKL